MFLKVHLKQNGNETIYPVRPYRSKDYLISTESSTLHRHNPTLKSMYSAEDESTSSRRNTLKETDLDQLLGSPNSAGSSATATIKALPLSCNRPLFSDFGLQKLSDDETSQYPLTVQRRSSFQAATKLNSFDFYRMQEPFFLSDRQTMKMNQYNHHYSPERDLREREHYREKRREYSPNLKDENFMDINREDLLEMDRTRANSLILENHMLTASDHLSLSSISDRQWREMNVVDEIDYQDRYTDSNDNERENFKDDNEDDNHLSYNDDYRDRETFDRISVDYQRDNDTAFPNYGLDDDRYRDNGIFV